MGDGLRTVWLLTNDDALAASTKSSAAALGGWTVRQYDGLDGLKAAPPAGGDVLILDSWLRGQNVYELLRTLGGRTGCRTYVAIDRENSVAESIARFCGATGVVHRPLSPSGLRGILEPAGAGPAHSKPRVDDVPSLVGFDLPEALLADIGSGTPDPNLIAALIDPATGLFNFAFLNYKLDEEFKRARRFGQPLACVMLGFEGQADDQVLRELAAIFLASSRDTDVLGRFDENSFLFLLPNTGPDGAEIMAERVEAEAAERKLSDLVGDRLVLSVGIATYPGPGFERREQLYAKAREAFLAAREEGGGVVVCP